MLAFVTKTPREPYGIARLLDEDLGEPDHLSVVSELLGQVDHGIARVLLLAGTCTGQKSAERSDRYRIATFSASRSTL